MEFTHYHKIHMTNIVHNLSGAPSFGWTRVKILRLAHQLITHRGGIVISYIILALLR
jgi:hypothetical protein